MAIEINGKSYETDEEGYLVDLNEWNEEVAKILAEPNIVAVSGRPTGFLGTVRAYTSARAGTTSAANNAS